MHDALVHRQKALEDDDDLASYAREVGLEVRRFDADRSARPAAHRVQHDVDTGLRVGVGGTPTLFLDGQRLRHHGLDDLLAALPAPPQIRPKGPPHAR